MPEQFYADRVLLGSDGLSSGTPPRDLRCYALRAFSPLPFCRVEFLATYFLECGIDGRNDLIHDFLIGSCEAAELLQVFLTGRGFGASPEAARDAVGRVERSGCSTPVLQRELEDLALVM
jgi:hypothetical protein